MLFVCSFDLDNKLYFNVIIAPYFGLIPFGVCLVSYYKIFQTVYRSKNKVKQGPAVDHGQKKKKTRNATKSSSKTERQIYKSLLIVFLTYTISEQPALIVCLDKEHIISISDVVVMYCLHLLLSNGKCN